MLPHHSPCPLISASWSAADTMVVQVCQSGRRNAWGAGVGGAAGCLPRSCGAGLPPHQVLLTPCVCSHHRDSRNCCSPVPHLTQSSLAAKLPSHPQHKVLAILYLHVPAALPLFTSILKTTSRLCHSPDFEEYAVHVFSGVHQPANLDSNCKHS